MLEIGILLGFALSAGACSGKLDEEPRRSGSDDHEFLVLAVDGPTIAFPSDPSFVAGDPNFEFVTGTGEQVADERDYIVQILACAPVAWTEKTSHSVGIVVPTERSDAWTKSVESPISTQDIINCVRGSTAGPVAYRMMTNGTGMWTGP